MLLSRQPRAEPSRLAWLSRIPIAVTSGRINRNLYTLFTLYRIKAISGWIKIHQHMSIVRFKRAQEPLRVSCFSWTSTSISCNPGQEMTHSQKELIVYSHGSTGMVRVIIWELKRMYNLYIKLAVKYKLFALYLYTNQWFLIFIKKIN